MLTGAVAILVFVVPRSDGTTIIRSKSNISNNRMASPIGEGQPGPSDAVVICESCKFSGMPEQGYLVLMDSQTGEIWAYSDDAVVGKADPEYVGTLLAVGKRIVRNRPPQPR
jgi:hypothetical protein